MGFLPFVLLGYLYLAGANNLREKEHQTGGGESAASTKLMPLPNEMWDGFTRSALQPDPKGEVRLVVDTWASVKRFAVGITIVAVAGVLIGLYMGTFPLVDAFLYYFFVFIKNIPPLLILPILFIYLDVGELSKIALVVIGVLPGVVLDARKRAQEIAREELYKAQSLGATDQEITWSIIFPQILPRMIGSLRLNFQAAWCYVIAGESIAAAAGIGYRIFVLRRYVAMDVIIPYVIWATIIMFVLEYTFQWLENRFRWVDK
jgi:NitT/TauT family transport system permease protein